MKKFYFYFLVGIIISSCTESVKKENNGKNQEQVALRKEKERRDVVKNQDYRLWHTIDQFNLTSFEYYGEFYDDRLKFYYATSPGIHLGPANIDLIMLYFLDERLVKIRYNLDSDVSEHLLDSLGMGKLNTKFTRGKEVLATEKSVKKLKAYYVAEGLSDEFNIQWDRAVIESTFLVDYRNTNTFSFDTIPSKYIYIDQLKSYSERLMQIENNKTIEKLKTNTLP